MFQFNCLDLKKENLFTFFALFFIAVFAIGGCNDNNGGGANGSDTSACTALTDPCAIISETGGIIECVLSATTCVVDLGNIIGQLRGQNFNVSDSSILYMGAWGGNGGSANENGGGSSFGGYTQTTTTVSDIVNLKNGSSLLYYFLGSAGGTGPNHCGGGGGAATIVTFEDLTLNPGAEPTLDLLYMIAGGGGGAAGGTVKGCTTKGGPGGARGGNIVAPESDTPDLIFRPGAGCNGTTDGCGTTVCGEDCEGKRGGVFIAEGGGGDDDSATGGDRTCCLQDQTPSTNGLSGIGGLGGVGGQGVKCTKVQAAGFRNASLSFSTGQGGDGGSGGLECNTGGGSGGGGAGGGGGGGHGGGGVQAQSGGGGGSAVMNSTQDTSKSPSTRPGNPCGSNGCLAITFFEDQN